MWATLALATALQLSPAQAGLAIENPVPTFGLYGQARKDAKVLLGDQFWLSYQITGLKVNENGGVSYSVAMELTNSKNETIFQQEPQNLDSTNTLGGSNRPGFAYLDIGRDTSPGKYQIKLKVTDRVAKASKELIYPFEVVADTFGFVRSVLKHQNVPSPPVGVPGQEVLISFSLVGFKLNEKEMQPDIAVEMSVIDLGTGKPTLSNPFKGGVKKVDEKYKKMIPMEFVVQLNRTGRYRFDIKATDNLSTKSETLSMYFTVLAPPKE